MTHDCVATPQADNTVRESKNQTMMKWLSWILLHKGLQLSGIFFHRVGHTHGTLGGSANKLLECMAWVFVSKVGTN